MIFRDVSKSPYKNPTNLENPAPVTYAPKTHEISGGRKTKKNRGGSQSFVLTEDSVIIADEFDTKMDPNFASSVPRDFLQSVPKDLKQNPGPGSYLHD